MIPRKSSRIYAAEKEQIQGFSGCASTVRKVFVVMVDRIVDSYATTREILWLSTILDSSLR